MAPQHTDISNVVFEGHRTGRELTERSLEFSLRDVLRSLKKLDYTKVVWRNVIIFIVLHLYAFRSLEYLFFVIHGRTFLFAILYGTFGGLGITMGAHRLWSHRSYSAKLPLRIILIIAQTIALQNDMFEWVRDHRVHHKFSETDADPHNANRGLFFSHMGWLMYKKHPDVICKGKTVDISDVLEDPVVRFQKKFYVPLAIFFSFVVPTIVPWYFWGEQAYAAFLVCGIFRYVLSLHGTWTVNSLAHWVGHRPYDQGIYPAENSFVALVALGEGWHNFHHVFPFDYRTSEFGGLVNINLTCSVIDFCARMGWAYDLKTVDRKIVEHRMKRTGRSYPIY